jgi:FdhD protein
MEKATASVEVTRSRGGRLSREEDRVVVEEPLEIRAAWEEDGTPREKNIAVTMRTPGDDADLALGFLFTEGLIRAADEIESVRQWGSPNVIRVAMRRGARIETANLDRHFYTSSSCGVCGKASIDAQRVVTEPLPDAAPPDPEVIRALPEALRAQQTAFHATGSMHGAALFDRSGTLLCVREDIGRHNAVDKVIGAKFAAGETPLRDTLLMISSRTSFEIVQKAVMAGIPLVASVGGPSSLAIELARSFGVTLLGFVRDGGFNVYSGRL